jgi:hypothetical protein
MVLVLGDDPPRPIPDVSPSRPQGPLSNPERVEAVRAVLLALLDLHAPKVLSTPGLLDLFPWHEHARVRSQLKRLEHEGLLRRLHGDGRHWWGSVILPLSCEFCLEPGRMVVTTYDRRRAIPWRQIVACGLDHRERAW